MSLPASDRLTLRVAGIRRLTSVVKAFVLQSPDGRPLPPFTAGAHIDLRDRDGATRRYSLAGDPRDRYGYEVAVLRSDRAGSPSRWLHDVVREGDVIHASPPRNDFPLDRASRRYRFLAAGIGVTPILAMVRESLASRKPFDVWYTARTQDAAPYLDELRLLVPATRLHVALTEGDARRRLRLAAALADIGPGCTVYCSGPQSFLDAARAAAASLPERAVRFDSAGPHPAHVVDRQRPAGWCLY